LGAVLDDRTDRIYYFDWLRVISVTAVFFHHCSRIFDVRSVQLYNAITSLPPTIHREFNNLWMMPLLFIISGAAVYYSMKLRKVGGFIKERLLRILLPLLTIGIFVITPPQVYIERLINGEFTGNFFKWYPHYFKGIYPQGNFYITGSHLWYLWYLFAYTLVLLLFFIPIGKQRVSIFSRFSNLFNKSWGLLLLFIPMAAIAPLEIYSNRLAGGWDLLPYLIFFICGYLFFSNEYIQESIRKYCIVSLVAAFIFSIIYLYIMFSAVIPEIRTYMLTGYKTLMSLSGNALNPPDMSVALIGFFVLRHMAACCWMIAMLGLGSRFLNFNNRFLAYANEAVLPFYILHMTIINIIAYFINQWSNWFAVNYVIIAISSFIAIMFIYELFIRRINVLRFLFGMKLKKSIKG
jgi:glucans biosynthesis protein C